ncbi:acid phosphatase [Phenylobacterium sp.]|uniref:acid phosphatase n=1 Tax=Phenylobacterium sp. TaxID=1871053 RepID=UPI003D2C7C30
MRVRVGLAALVAGIAAFGSATGQPPPSGYLTTTPDAAQILRPAPKEGDARDLEDKRLYEAARKLEGGPRWAQAQADVPYAISNRIANFSCAVGVKLDAASAPKLALVLTRTSMDVGRLNTAAKAVYSRARPYKRWGGTICTEKSPALDNSFDYPSGHAQLGWGDALVVAEIAPDRAAQVLARGRAFADSRAVCGVHTVSAVDAGMTLASAQFALTQSSPAYRADLEAARAELAALRASGPKPDAAMCAKEAELNKSPF